MRWGQGLENFDTFCLDRLKSEASPRLEEMGPNYRLPG